LRAFSSTCDHACRHDDARDPDRARCESADAHEQHELAPIGGVPLATELIVRGTLRSLEGRKALIALSLSASDEECATGEMIAVEFRKPD
jgi:hypothetical protein